MESGRHIAHFRILDELGAGGMGVVYRAHDLVLRRDVALKLVRPERATPDMRRRFLHEARVAATLSHPNIAAIYQAGELEEPDGDTSLYVAQEFVEGETLASLVQRGPLAHDRAIALALQLLDGLGEAHGRGIVHRDIKPSNLVVTPGGRLKILDFGIARRLAAPNDTTALLDGDTVGDVGTGGTIAGTPGYMAPEQLRGFADVRTDIFAAGCVLYEMLAGHPLVGAQSLWIDERSVREALASLRRQLPDLPEATSAAIERAVAHDPERRYPEAGTFAAALRDPVAIPVARATHSIRTVRARASAMAAVSLLVLALVFGIWRWSQPALAFAERDWVLIGSVVNETGEAVFDSALEGALEADLRQSRYVNVFDEGQLANALRSMRLPPATRIDLDTGRNVCRLAGIRVLLMPKIVSVGEAYQLEASLVDPATGRVVDQLRVTARGREDVLMTGIDEFTRLVRRRLGESLSAIEKTDPQLIEFATPSWDALRFLRLGGEALAEPDVPRAARAFEQALEHDPNFPAALASLGLLYIELLNKAKEGNQLLEAAFARSAGTSEREHLMVSALHKQFVTADAAGALEDYRFLSSLYPDMFQPYNNSGRILMQLGRYTEAVAMLDKAHALDPRHAFPLWNLWELHLNRLDDPSRAATLAQMLASLQPDNPWVRHVTAWTDVALRDFERAERGMREVLSALPLHPYAIPNLGHLLLRRGAAEEAATVYRGLLEQARQGVINVATPDVTLFLGLALSLAGREDEARAEYETEIRRMTALPQPRAPTLEARLSTLYAAAGHTARAERIVALFMAKPPNNPWLLYTLARTSALLRDREKAADLLRKARAAGYDQPYFVLVDPAFRDMQDEPVIDELAVRPPSGG